MDNQMQESSLRCNIKKCL
uniref:Uncharacterized protein n=1 Tax=Arundo donax TaxID=35708 RepID=A0A0A8Y8Q8_ARUDO